MVRTHSHVSALCALALLATACDDGNSSGISSPIDVSGRVLAAENGRPVGDVTVIAPDGREATTDTDGGFSLVYSKDKKGSIKARSTIAAPVEKPAPQGKGYVELYVKAYDGQADVDGEAGGEVAGGAGAHLKINAGTLSSKNGKLANTKLVIAAPNPKKTTDLPSIPGNFDAQQSTDKRGKLSLKSSVYVSAQAGGEEFTLKGGAKASLDLPIRDSDKKAAGDSASLYRYDFERGIWVQEGSAVEAVNESGQPVYRGEVGTLGWWTVGNFYEQLTCLHGCVKNPDGSAASSARVLVNALDQEIQLVTYAGEDGCYAIDVLSQARLSLVAQSQGGFAGPVVLTSGTTIASAETAPTACQEVPSVLTLQPVTAGGCGQGMSECNGSCVDTSFDPAHCGNCATACESAQCVSAQCVAPSNPGNPGDAGAGDGAVDPIDPDQPTQTLVVSGGGNGAGTITSFPSGISCGASCQASFSEGATVTLKAVPDSASSSFLGWSGDCASFATADCNLTLDAPRSAVANFQLESRGLTVSVTGGPMGNVSGTVGAAQVINCGGAGTDCSETLDHGTTVVLTANPLTNMQHTWGGVCAGVMTPSCTVPMNGAKFVSVTFAPIQYTLTFHTKDQGINPPAGYGTVTMVTPATGFSCVNDYLNVDRVCTQVLNAGTTIQLHAQGDQYNYFIGWGGACSTFTNAQDCVLTVNGNLSAFADFVGVIL